MAAGGIRRRLSRQFTLLSRTQPRWQRPAANPTSTTALTPLRTPGTLVAVDVKLDKILDLTDGAIRKSIGVSATRMQGDDWPKVEPAWCRIAHAGNWAGCVRERSGGADCARL